jgi:hypothetical protein
MHAAFVDEVEQSPSLLTFRPKDAFDAGTLEHLHGVPELSVSQVHRLDQLLKVLFPPVICALQAPSDPHEDGSLV